MPDIGPDVRLENPAFIHHSAAIYGKVTIREGASVWCNVAMRAESHEVVVGPYTNIQDFVMIHVGASTGTYIGSHCSITHHCTIHGCTLGDNVLEKVREAGLRPIGDEGLRGGEWGLIDLDNVVVHIFQPTTRQFYDLERLWRGAEQGRAQLPAAE